MMTRQGRKTGNVSISTDTIKPDTVAPTITEVESYHSQLGVRVKLTPF
jgi:hypothetical protein